MMARALDMYLLGFSEHKCCTVAQVTQHQLENVRKSKVGQAYLKEAVDILGQDAPVQKKKLIMNLYSRLQTSNDNDAVKIVKTLNEMMDYGQPEVNTAVQVNINWTTDPWKPIKH